MAQLVARFVRIEEVRGSIPLSSTTEEALTPSGGSASSAFRRLFCIPAQMTAIVGVHERGRCANARLSDLP